MSPTLRRQVLYNVPDKEDVVVLAISVDLILHFLRNITESQSHVAYLKLTMAATHTILFFAH